MIIITQIQTSAQRAADLTQQLLAYSGKGRFVIKVINLSQVVNEMAHLLKVSISKKVEIVYSLNYELPGIEADATQIRQVVMN